MPSKQQKITDLLKPKKKSGKNGVEKRKINRFGGMSEEEVAKRGLPDYLKKGKSNILNRLSILVNFNYFFLFNN